jgi:serine/threonine protein kinase
MSSAVSQSVLVGRYAIFDRIATGGMAAVHVARLAGEGGFARTVAVKRLHPQFALDPEFLAMFMDEARLAARIRHPNVVPTLDIVADTGELFLVMEYVEGESLAALLRRARELEARVPVEVATGVMVQALHGLHAAHEATNDLGEPLDLVHRDVSPQNVLVGTDGVVRVLDFGVAKALGKLHTTRDGQLKGKLGYLAPEQVFGLPVTRRSDVFAAAVVLWEALTGARLFAADSEGEVLRRIMDGVIALPSEHAEDVPAALDAIVMRALSREPADRFDTAQAMADAIEEAAPVASPRTIRPWMYDLARDVLEARAQLVAGIESGAPISVPSSRAPFLESPGPATLLEDPEKRTQTAISVDHRDAPALPRRVPWARVAIVMALCCVAGGGVVVARSTQQAPVAPPSLEIAPGTTASVRAIDPVPERPAQAADAEAITLSPSGAHPATPAPRPLSRMARPHAPPSPSAPARATPSAPTGTGLYTRE